MQVQLKPKRPDGTLVPFLLARRCCGTPVEGDIRCACKFTDAGKSRSAGLCRHLPLYQLWPNRVQLLAGSGICTAEFLAKQLVHLDGETSSRCAEVIKNTGETLGPHRS